MTLEQIIQATLNKHYRVIKHNRVMARGGDFSSYRCACGAEPWLNSHLASELSKAVQPHEAAWRLAEATWWRHLSIMYEESYFAIEGDKRIAALAAHSSQSEPAAPASDAPMPHAQLLERITDYLTKGGLFNPESMEHEKVSELLRDCRDALAAESERLRGEAK